MPAITVSIDATWLDRDQKAQAVELEATTVDAPVERDLPLAVRAARLWHAHIIARALELNERGEFEQAETWIRSAHREFRSYVDGLPEMSDLLRRPAACGEPCRSRMEDDLA